MTKYYLSPKVRLWKGLEVRQSNNPIWMNPVMNDDIKSVGFVEVFDDKTELMKTIHPLTKKDDIIEIEIND